MADDEGDTLFGADGRTQIRTLSRPRGEASAAAEWLHSLRVVEGEASGRRLRVGASALTVGRRSPCELVLNDPEVSGRHCTVRVPLGQMTLEVVDLGSTNGTYVDGRPVVDAARVRVGGRLQLGSHVLVHECLPPAEMLAVEAAEADLARAAHYVQALLPPPIEAGPVRTDWFYRPSARVGGDAFGYVQLDGRNIAGYVVDVTGHGTGAALHTVTVMNTLRRRALPETDFLDPAEVLGSLNRAFDMEQHDGLCFTMWYGVYDAVDRRLRYASAGHHAACLRVPGESGVRPLRTPGLAVGAVPEATYRNAEVEVAPGSRLYIFSDGLFELVDRDGRQWGFGDLLPFIADSPSGPGEAERLVSAVRDTAGTRTFDDDCSLVIVTFLS